VSLILIFWYCNALHFLQVEQFTNVVALMSMYECISVNVICYCLELAQGSFLCAMLQGQGIGFSLCQSAVSIAVQRTRSQPPARKFHRSKTNKWPALQTIGVQPFKGKGPLPLLGAGSRVQVEKITVSGILNRLNYCVLCSI